MILGFTVGIETMSPMSYSRRGARSRVILDFVDSDERTVYSRVTILGLHRDECVLVLDERTVQSRVYLGFTATKTIDERTVYSRVVLGFTVTKMSVRSTNEERTPKWCYTVGWKMSRISVVSQRVFTNHVSALFLNPSSASSSLYRQQSQTTSPA